mmetsp:Transcript_14548/g.24651  ORF Transcript_14548/g.24651 Transcript_14548/m.24651 type:complete len:242 (-) Transcript_14548:2032-2757(-)
MLSNPSHSPSCRSGRATPRITVSRPSHVGPYSVVGNVGASSLGNSGRTATTAWSYKMQLKEPYIPSMIQYSRVSLGAASASAGNWSRTRLENTCVHKVAMGSAMYRPGSDITRTPSLSGKNFSREELMASATALKATPSASADMPEKPPPMSSKVNLVSPSSPATSNAAFAMETARGNAAGSVAPLPTWKLTPTTLRFRRRAALSRGTISSCSAPYLVPRGQRAVGSSALMRRIQDALGKC